MADLSPVLQNLREALERYKAVTKTAADRAQAALVLVTAASLERLLRDLLKASMRTMGKKKGKAAIPRLWTVE